MKRLSLPFGTFIFFFAVAFPVFANQPNHPFASSELENGTVTSPASVVTDSSASGGQAITVGTASENFVCNGPRVSAGQDIQAVIDSLAEGASICLKAGTHRVTSALAPKANQKIIGEVGAIVSGAKVITGFTASGSNYVADGFLPATPGSHGECATDGCTYTQDVFLDGVPLVRVLSQGAVGPGKFYTDYANNKIYVGDDPSGHTIEQSYAPRLIASGNAGVTVRNLILQMAANEAQSGAVEPTSSSAAGWTVAYNEVRYNHGVGIGPGAYGGTYTLSHNYVHHNGHAGVGANGANNVVEYNEIAHNNQASYQDTAGEWYEANWEGGGGKFGGAGTHDLLLKGNYSHDNRGVGLWCDINCGAVTVDGNYFKDNSDAGFEYEISYGEVVSGDGKKTVIKNNVTVHNTSGTQGNGVGILISASRDVEAFNNECYNEARCIWAFQQNRTDSPDSRGAHDVKNLYIHDNVMNFNGPDPLWSGKTGLWTDTGRTDIYSSSFNNVWEDNTYYHSNTGIPWFDWPLFQTFTQWQTAGQDTNGSISSSNPSAPATPQLVVGPQSNGNVSQSITIPAEATYRVWSRIKAPDATNNSFNLQIDDTNQVTVGDASITADTWTWVDYQNGSTSTKVNASLTAGTHTFKVIGRESQVQVDKIIVTTDTGCVPTGTGENCTLMNAGYETWNGSFDGGNNNKMSATQITTDSVGGPLKSISIYMGETSGPNKHIQVAVYSDNGSNNPGSLLASSSSHTITPDSWNTISFTGITLSANTKYFLVFNVDDAETQFGWNSTGTGVSRWKNSVSFGTWPSSFGNPTLSRSQQYSIYLSYAATSSPTQTNTTAGYQTWSGTFDGGNNNLMSATQVTTGGVGGSLQNIKIYMGTPAAAPYNHIQVALYSDNGSNNPGALLAASSSQTITADSWNTITITGVTIEPNTKYFLVFNLDGGSTQFGWNSTGTGASRWKSGTTFGTWPSSFGTPTLSETQQYAIYMTY